MYSERLYVNNKLVAYIHASNGTDGTPIEDADELIPEIKEYATNLLADMVVN